MDYFDHARVCATLFSCTFELHNILTKLHNILCGTLNCMQHTAVCAAQTECSTPHYVQHCEGMMKRKAVFTKAHFHVDLRTGIFAEFIHRQPHRVTP